MSTEFGVWVAALFTICFFTFLYKENQVFRTVEHIYVGLTAAYTVGFAYHTRIVPTVTTDILQDGKWSYILPIILGLLIYTRYFPQVSWLARYPLSFWVGYGAGMVLAFTVAPLMGQLTALMRSWVDFNAFLLWVFSLAVLIYFFFTVKREYPFIGYPAWLGRWVIVVGLGAAFGNTVLYRWTLFVGRMQFLLFDWLGIGL